MSEEKKIVNWSELEKAEDSFTQTVLCPVLSKKLGTEIHVKVRAIERLEFLGALNFPMAEIDQMIADDVDQAVFVKAVQEHAAASGVKGLLDSMEAVIEIGLVDPDPKDGQIGKLTPDFETIFKAIVDLTLPPEAVAKAGQFRKDGEQ